MKESSEIYDIGIRTDQFKYMHIQVGNRVKLDPLEAIGTQSEAEMATQVPSDVHNAI